MVTRLGGYSVCSDVVFPCEDCSLLHYIVRLYIAHVAAHNELQVNLVPRPFLLSECLRGVIFVQVGQFKARGMVRQGPSQLFNMCTCSIRESLNTGLD